MEHVTQLEGWHREYWADYEPIKPAVFTAPEELATGIEPAVGFITRPRTPQDLGLVCARVAWKPNEIDLAHLAQGGVIWLSTWGGLPPHQLEVQPPPRTIEVGR